MKWYSIIYLGFLGMLYKYCPTDPTIRAIAIGLLSFLATMWILGNGGFRSTFLHPDRCIKKKMFQLVEVGDLEEIKKMSETMSVLDLREMHLAGLKSILIYAV